MEIEGAERGGVPLSSVLAGMQFELDSFTQAPFDSEGYEMFWNKQIGGAHTILAGSADSTHQHKLFELLHHVVRFTSSTGRKNHLKTSHSLPLLSDLSACIVQQFTPFVRTRLASPALSESQVQAMLSLQSFLEDFSSEVSSSIAFSSETLPLSDVFELLKTFGRHLTDIGNFFNPKYVESSRNKSKNKKLEKEMVMEDENDKQAAPSSSASSARAFDIHHLVIMSTIVQLFANLLQFCIQDSSVEKLNDIASKALPHVMICQYSIQGMMEDMKTLTSSPLVSPAQLPQIERVLQFSLEKVHQCISQFLVADYHVRTRQYLRRTQLGKHDTGDAFGQEAAAFFESFTAITTWQCPRHHFIAGSLDMLRLFLRFQKRHEEESFDKVVQEMVTEDQRKKAEAKKNKNESFQSVKVSRFREEATKRSQQALAQYSMAFVMRFIFKCKSAISAVRLEVIFNTLCVLLDEIRANGLFDIIATEKYNFTESKAIVDDVFAKLSNPPESLAHCADTRSASFHVLQTILSLDDQFMEDHMIDMIQLTMCQAPGDKQLNQSCSDLFSSLLTHFSAIRQVDVFIDYMSQGLTLKSLEPRLDCVYSSSSFRRALRSVFQALSPVQIPPIWRHILETFQRVKTTLDDFSEEAAAARLPWMMLLLSTITQSCPFNEDNVLELAKLREATISMVVLPCSKTLIAAQTKGSLKSLSPTDAQLSAAALQLLLSLHRISHRTHSMVSLLEPGSARSAPWLRSDGIDVEKLLPLFTEPQVATYTLQLHALSLSAFRLLSLHEATEYNEFLASEETINSTLSASELADKQAKAAKSTRRRRQEATRIADHLAASLVQSLAASQGSSNSADSSMILDAARSSSDFHSLVAHMCLRCFKTICLHVSPSLRSSLVSSCLRSGSLSTQQLLALPKALDALVLSLTSSAHAFLSSSSSVWAESLSSSDSSAKSKIEKNSKKLKKALKPVLSSAGEEQIPSPSDDLIQLMHKCMQQCINHPPASAVAITPELEAHVQAIVEGTLHLSSIPTATLVQELPETLLSLSTPLLCIVHHQLQWFMSSGSSSSLVQTARITLGSLLSGFPSRLHDQIPVSSAPAFLESELQFVSSSASSAVSDVYIDSLPLSSSAEIIQSLFPICRDLYSSGDSQFDTKLQVLARTIHSSIRTQMASSSPSTAAILSLFSGAVSIKDISSFCQHIIKQECARVVTLFSSGSAEELFVPLRLISSSISLLSEVISVQSIFHESLLEAPVISSTEFMLALNCILSVASHIHKISPAASAVADLTPTFHVVAEALCTGITTLSILSKNQQQSDYNAQVVRFFLDVYQWMQSGFSFASDDSNRHQTRALDILCSLGQMDSPTVLTILVEEALAAPSAAQGINRRFVAAHCLARCAASIQHIFLNSVRHLEDVFHQMSRVCESYSMDMKRNLSIASGQDQHNQEAQYLADLASFMGWMMKRFVSRLDKFDLGPFFNCLISILGIYVPSEMGPGCTPPPSSSSSSSSSSASGVHIVMPQSLFLAITRALQPLLSHHTNYLNSQRFSNSRQQQHKLSALHPYESAPLFLLTVRLLLVNLLQILNAAPQQGHSDATEEGIKCIDAFDAVCHEIASHQRSHFRLGFFTHLLSDLMEVLALYPLPDVHRPFVNMALFALLRMKDADDSVLTRVGFIVSLPGKELLRKVVVEYEKYNAFTGKT